MSGVRNLYNETDYFFGKDENDGKQGRLFVALNYKGTNFGQAINTIENPETIKGEPIFQLMLAKNYNGADGKPLTDANGKPHDDNVLSEDFVKFIETVAAHHRTLDQVGSATGLKTIDFIYGNWGIMTPEGRDFFNTFVNLVSTSNREITSPVPGTITGEVRVNLKKVDDKNNKSDTVFGSTLPFLPSGMVLVSDKTKVLGVDYLHKLYDDNVRGVTMAGGALDFAGWTKLDQNRFLRNVLHVQKQVSTGALNVKSPLDDIYDLSTGVTYTRGATGELLRNGNPINEDKEDFTLGLPSGDLVFECLLSGDPKALSRCLRNLTIENMYNVVRTEVVKMNPKVMTKVLSTFDIKTDKFGKVEEYIEWRGNLESRLSQKMGAERGAKTASAILGNKKLIEYLRNIMEIVRSNPAITSPVQAALSDLPDKTDKKINYFIKPKVDRASAISTHLGVLMQQLNLVPQNLVSSLQMPLGVVGAGFNPLMAAQITGSPFGMVGGGCVDETAAHMEALYKQILEEMKRNGKDLVDADKRRIQEAIDQIKTNNARLNEALEDLKRFMKLNSALTAGLTNVTLNDAKGSRNINLSSQVANLESCVNRTARDQVGLITAVVDQVLRPMILLTQGVAAPGIRAL